MSMLDSLKAKLTECRKAGLSVQMSVLQVVLGDASMIEARTGKKASDEEVEKLIRKTMLGNQETLGLMEKQGTTTGDNVTKLTAENVFLQTLLPKTMSVDEIASELQAVIDAIKGAKSDGQATGAAMKHLKSKNLKALGDDVTSAVKKLRA